MKNHGTKTLKTKVDFLILYTVVFDTNVIKKGVKDRRRKKRRERKREGRKESIQ